MYFTIDLYHIVESLFKNFQNYCISQKRQAQVQRERERERQTERQRKRREGEREEREKEGENKHLTVLVPFMQSKISHLTF